MGFEGGGGMNKHDKNMALKGGGVKRKNEWL